MSALLRLLAGAVLAVCVILAVAAPETAFLADAAVAFIALLTVLRPAFGLAGVVALAPAALLLAPLPARVAELLAWTFVATILLRRRGIAEPVASVRTPAWLFAACVAASWCGLIVAGAAGVEPGFIPGVMSHTIRADHLLYSSPEPETWTMLQMFAGLALFVAAMSVTRADERAARWTAWALVASGVFLAVATGLDVLRQWAGQDFGSWYLLRYVRGERFSLHLADLNAAGSLYVLSGLTAVALATVDRAGRWRWVAAAVLMLPALWLTGSRSAALGAMVIGASVIPIARRRAYASRAVAGAAAIVVLAVAVAGATAAAADRQDQGTAASALSMRAQFLVTSARMFASAPVFGVGVGHYHERSAEFMPPSLHAIYPFENAHNYFAQQFAELGLVGGLLFVWLVIAGVRAGWTGLSAAPERAAPQLALVAGCAGYLLTCVTGHPLLVPEAALPFWGAFGVMAAAAAPSSSGAGLRIAATCVIVLLVGGVALQARRYASVTAPPTEQGFHAEETGKDGRRFNWMTRHGVFYIGSQPGFVVIPVRAPDLPQPRLRAFAVDVDVAGRRMGTYAIEAGRWNEIRVGVRDRARLAFRRVDVWANQQWTPRELGSSEDDTPRSVMIGAVRWEPFGAR